MIMNAAFLVQRDQEQAFDRRIKEIASNFDKLTFKYTGPVAAVQLRQYPPEAGARRAASGASQIPTSNSQIPKDLYGS